MKNRDMRALISTTWTCFAMTVAVLPISLHAQDTTPPDTTITSGPSGLVNSSSASFSFNSTEAGSTFEARMDTNAFAPASSPKTYTGLTEGAHTFQVRATDSSNNTDPTPASRGFSVDTIPPDTTITGGPSGTVNIASASFSFNSTEAGSTFEVQMDGGGYTAASSPKTFTSLADGAHTFQVRAIDAAGNTDATPASRGFTVDTTPPDTTITSGPSGPTSNASPSFSFTSTETGSTFEAKMDAGLFASATSPKSYTGLTDGAHTFQVRAIDTAGNADATPATRSFTVDTTPPDTSITSGPSGVTSNASPSFSFNSTEIGSTFEAKMDTGSFGPATSPTSYSGLSDGTHTFQVRAIDAAGNLDATPASRSFTVDTIGPVTTIVSGPSGLVTTNRATFGFISSESPPVFEVKLDGRPYLSATSPYTWTNLTSGNHTFTVRAFDQAGNPDSAPATRTWTISLPFSGSNQLTIARTNATQVTVSYFGDPNASYTLQQSSNLFNWSAWYAAVSATNGLVQQVDSLGADRHFYRAVASPNGSTP